MHGLIDSQLRSHTTDYIYLKFKDFHSHREKRIQSQKQAYASAGSTKGDNLNSTLTYGLKEKFTSAIEAALLKALLHDETGDIPLKWLDVFLVEERFPYREGWRPRDIKVKNLIDDALKYNLGLF